MTPFPVTGEIKVPGAVPIDVGDLTKIPEIVLGQTRTFHPDPYGAYAAGQLPTPFTGGAPRPHALSSGAATVDARADNRNFIQKKVDGVKDAVGGAVNPVDGFINWLDAKGKAAWDGASPYLASAGLMAVALLLLILGFWALTAGGGGTTQVEVEVAEEKSEDKPEATETSETPAPAAPAKKPARKRKAKTGGK